jgi:hypothetical protein
MIDRDRLRQHIQALNSGDEPAVHSALDSLRRYVETDWAALPGGLMDALVSALKDQLAQGSKRAVIRQGILAILANIGAPAESAVPALITLLERGVPERICEDAVIALGRIGEQAAAAAEPLVRLLGHCRAPLAGHVIHTLSSIGSANPNVRTSLVALWQAQGQSQGNQVQVAFALCKLRIEAPGLLAFVTHTAAAHQESALRKLACEALAFCDPNEVDVVPVLLTAALHDKDEKVRNSADASLAHLNLSHEQAVAACVRQLKDARHAEAALRNSGALAVAALTDVLGTREPAAKEKALRILGCLGEAAAAAAPAVTAALRDKDMVIRLAAAKCLWNITKEAAIVVPVLVALLDEKWSAAEQAGEARRRFLQTVIEALCRIGPAAHAAVPALTAKTKDKNRNISESATSALKVIAPGDTKLNR